ncbi:hypothetical protein KZZ20_05810 [Methylacidiphilum fumariolicum]|nr:hypothetical protein [Candidatus Methylacidiphilum fumarolicum]MBW6415028.1 hypothetical protein [Candidatus Methylacidiphilum fumarolicum]
MADFLTFPLVPHRVQSMWNARAWSLPLRISPPYPNSNRAVTHAVG